MTKSLLTITQTCKPIQRYGITDIQIAGITADSRKVQPGFLFVAVKGHATDGHKFIDNAIAAGAVAIVAETEPKNLDTSWILVEDAAFALGAIANLWYDKPSAKLQLVAITGTNGKTSTATLLYQLFSGLGYKTGLLSTVENRIGDKVVPSTHTTPDAVSLQALLAEMVNAGCTYAFMEASSHAIEQQRIAGISLKGAIFSNITHDHLDYHGTFKKYLEAKKKLFDYLPKEAWALTNIDDRNGKIMVQNTQAKVHTYSLRRLADFRVKIIEDSILGLHLELDGTEVQMRLVGSFNAYNLLAVYATALLLGQSKIDTLQVLSNLRGAEGRFETVYSQKRDVLGIVDYAHTPDALEQVLNTIRKMRNDGGKIITVVGCGGDRDTSKRPIMARTAANLSDKLIMTSDNPRSEQPEAILAEMAQGLDTEQRSRSLSMVNREEAIRAASMMAQAGDIILVAGKGHEKYQEIQGEKLPFDDKAVLIEVLA